jgi:hypothetical protein
MAIPNNVFIVDVNGLNDVIAEFLTSEFTFGAFHVDDFLSIQKTTFRITRREIRLPHPSDPKLSLYLFVSRW